MAITNHKRVGKALELLKIGLSPFVEREFKNIFSVLSETGVPVKYIQAVLRHKKLSTTERYLHRLGDSVKSALQVLERRVPWYTWEQKSLLSSRLSSEGR